eukprot:3093617-Alexandrium_andersonii.AAC.1
MVPTSIAPIRASPSWGEFRSGPVLPRSPCRARVCGLIIHKQQFRGAPMAPHRGEQKQSVRHADACPLRPAP